MTGLGLAMTVAPFLLLIVWLLMDVLIGERRK